MSVEGSTPVLDGTQRAALAAALVALDPVAFGGVVLRSPRADRATAWIAHLTALRPERSPVGRLPISIGDDRLLGGLDLAMTLATGRPVAERGLLARHDGGLLVLPCAERAGETLVARLAAVLDTHVAVPRGPFAGEPADARIGLIALDESEPEDEPIHAALADRLAFHLTLDVEDDTPYLTREEIDAAARRWHTIEMTHAQVATLVATAELLGVASVRALSFAVRTARGRAALDGRTHTSDDDCAAAAALVLGPRATRRPPATDNATESPPPPPPPSADAEPPPSDSSETPSADEVKALEEMLIQAALATLPMGLTMSAPAAAPRAGRSSGRAGMDRAGGRRGRQVGTRRGDPRAGGRLDLLETLRAAAPWQRLRPAPAGARERVRIQVRPDDFRIRRLVEPTGTTAIFVVDASGSAALNRMAEAKGAVELLLADAYSRRDEVALIAFRGTTADVLLAPTRAIAAAKRALAALPGGGGTPLASAIDRARELADRARRDGNDTIVVFLTDARANIARDGTPGRPAAEADATASATLLRQLGGTTLLIDTSTRPSTTAQALATAMGARYVALPRTDAQSIHAAVTAVRPTSS
ncbi:MAG: magnesium chelatase subunit D [Gemmatimonadetes bacterium]|nr:magnesium chelatase subunit D [Gemmatimonadota bacterium]